MKSDELKKNNADLHYNLGLTYFKMKHYSLSVEHLNKCTKLNPLHKFAFNNLAFIYNMHEYYSETIAICAKYELNLIDHQQRQNIQNSNKPNELKLTFSEETGEQVSHNCNRHWAFALYKKQQMANAIKKIQRAVTIDPSDAENWIVWALIMRHVGNY